MEHRRNVQVNRVIQGIFSSLGSYLYRLQNKFKKADAFKAIGNLLNVMPDEVDRKLRNISS